MRNARKHFPKYQSQILQLTSKILHGNKDKLHVQL
jgi:hypothetical protein